MTIKEKIKFHFINKKYARLTRTVAEGCTEISTGYIVAYSKDFIILHETADFMLLGYLVLPVRQITDIRFDKNDQYYHKIMVWEKEAAKAVLPYRIDLGSWQTIFNSLRSAVAGVIVECEDPGIDSFTIGPIIKATKKKVYIRYFSPTGIIDEKPTAIEFMNITKVTFDNRYINVFSRHTRQRKGKLNLNNRN